MGDDKRFRILVINPGSTCTKIYVMLRQSKLPKQKTSAFPSDESYNAVA